MFFVIFNRKPSSTQNTMITYEIYTMISRIDNGNRGKVFVYNRYTRICIFVWKYSNLTGNNKQLQKLDKVVFSVCFYVEAFYPPLSLKVYEYVSKSRVFLFICIITASICMVYCCFAI